MPRRARPWVAIGTRSRSSSRTVPPEGFKRPMTVFMSVVLPAPLRPMSPVMEPVGTSSDTPRKTCTEASETLRSRMLSMAPHHVAPYFRIGQRDLRRGVGDDAAVIEGEHALREAADHLHVMLDEEHGGAFGAHAFQHHLH